MSATRLLLFVLFFFGLFHIYLFISRDPGLQDTLVQAERSENLGFSAIATGTNHSCALGQRGGVWCWGDGLAGQLGHGRFSSSATPVPVVGLPEPALSVAVGLSTSCATLQSGSLWCWGSSLFGQIGLAADTPATPFPTRISGLGPVHTVALGHNHICAVEHTGRLACWGEKRVVRNHATYIEQHDRPKTLPHAPVFTTLDAGAIHTCGTTADQALYCWGASDSGALGKTEGRDRRVVPQPLRMESPGPVLYAAAGSAHTCLGTPTGVWCQGATDAYTPAQSTPRTDSPTFTPVVTSIAAGRAATCALRPTGRVACTGQDSPDPWNPFGENVPPLTNISAQDERICGLDTTGGAWCGPLLPDSTLESANHRPISWIPDNSLAARWNRVVGWWSQRSPNTAM